MKHIVLMRRAWKMFLTYEVVVIRLETFLVSNVILITDKDNLVKILSIDICLLTCCS